MGKSKAEIIGRETSYRKERIILEFEKKRFVFKANIYPWQSNLKKKGKGETKEGKRGGSKAQENQEALT